MVGFEIHILGILLQMVFRKRLIDGFFILRMLFLKGVVVGVKVDLRWVVDEWFAVLCVFISLLLFGEVFKYGCLVWTNNFKDCCELNFSFPIAVVVWVKAADLFLLVEECFLQFR